MPIRRKKTKKQEKQQEKPQESEQENEEPVFIPQSPHFMTVQPDYILPNPSKVLKKININDDLKNQIDSLCINIPDHQNNDTLQKIENEKKVIQYLIIQLASLKAFSRVQQLNDEFYEQEKSNYRAFLSILNKSNLDSENAYEQIIDEIQSEYKK